MKNFKLLLASTAILSMNTMNAMADLTESKQINVEANIVKTLDLEVVDHINFGTIAWDNTQDYASVILYATHPEEEMTNNVKFHTGQKPGKICFTDLKAKATVNFTDVHFMDEDTMIAVWTLGSDIDTSEEIGDGHNPYKKDNTAEEGKICYFVGGHLSTSSDGMNYSGPLSGQSTVTVIYGME